MGIIVESLAPSLLIFSFAAFVFFISLPRLKIWLKTRFDKKLRDKEPVEWTEFFIFTFLIAFAKYSDPIAGLYLGSSVLILLYPLYNPLLFVAYILILALTTISFTRFVITGFIAREKSLAKAKVFL